MVQGLFTIKVLLNIHQEEKCPAHPAPSVSSGQAFQFGGFTLHFRGNSRHHGLEGVVVVMCQCISLLCLD